MLLNKCLQFYDDGDDDGGNDDDEGNDDDDDDDDGDDDDDDDAPPGKPQHCPSPASPTPRQSTAKLSMRLY